MRKNGSLSKLLQDVLLITWDECSNSAHVEAVNRTFQHIKNSDAFMSDNTFVFASDFRQKLPVIIKGTQTNVIKAYLKLPPLWSSVEIFNQRTNMRAHFNDNYDNDFPQ